MAVKTVGGRAKKVGDRRLKQRAAARRAKSRADSAAAQREADTRRVLDGLVNQRYAPVQAALGQELRQAQAGPAAATFAWNAYQELVNAKRAESMGHYGQGIESARTLGANAQNNALATASRQQAAAQGRVVDGGQANLGEDIAGILGAYGATYQQDAQKAADANVQRFDAMAAQGHFQRNAQVAEAQNRIGQVQGKLTDLEADKGQFRVQALQEMQDRAFEQDLAERTLGLKELDSQRDFDLGMGRLLESQTARQADDTRADSQLALKGEELRAKIEQWAESNRLRDKEINTRGAGKGGKPRLSDAKKDQWRNKKARILSVRNGMREMLATGRYESTGQASAELKRLGYSRDEINMARDLQVLGYLSPANARFAKGYFPGGIIPQGFLANSPHAKKKRR